MTGAGGAIEGNLFALFPLFQRWPRAEAHDDPDMIWTLSDVPFPLFNSVLRARLEPARAEAAIDRAIARCRSRDVPLLWWTGPSTRPADLEARLAARGLYAEHAIGMAADLVDSPAARRRPAAVTVECVSSSQVLERWCEVLCCAFDMPAFVGDAFLGLTLALGLDDGAPFRHYLARLDGEPAGTCSVFYGAGVAGLYDVGTVSRARRRGVATCATRAAMEDARRRGCRTAVLHATPDGLSVYRALGFREHCRLGQFVWVPS